MINVSGPGCNETKAFVEAANMVGFQTLLRACQGQLANSGINYSSVDYGFSWQTSFPLSFWVWPLWKQVLSVVGYALPGIIAIVAIIAIITSYSSSCRTMFIFLLCVIWLAAATPILLFTK
jgi:hypothetical protein